MVWINLEILEGWRGHSEFPPQARLSADGLVEIRGFAEAISEESKTKPQVRLPVDMIPEIPDGQDKIVVDHFTTPYHYDGIEYPPTYGPRWTFFRDGRVLIEENENPTQPMTV